MPETGQQIDSRGNHDDSAEDAGHIVTLASVVSCVRRPIGNDICGVVVWPEVVHGAGWVAKVTCTVSLALPL